MLDKDELEEGMKLRVSCSQGVVDGKLYNNGEEYWYLTVTDSKENDRLTEGEDIKICREGMSFPSAGCVEEILEEL